MKMYEPFKKLLRTYIHLDNLKIETFENEQDYEKIYATALPALLPQLKDLCEEVQRCGKKMMLISLTINENSRQLLHLWNTYEVYDFQHSGIADFLDTDEDDWLDPWDLMLSHYIWGEVRRHRRILRLYQCRRVGRPYPTRTVRMGTDSSRNRLR